MSKKYIIDEDTLLDLLADSALLTALDCGGVDNWDWYGESRNDFLEQAIQEYDIENTEDYYFGFEELAEYELEHNIYPGIEELK